MKLKILLGICLTWGLSSLGLTQTNLTNLEYFFDTDPGFGNGTAVTISPNPNQNLNINLSLSGLTMGMHYLFIRFKDANNQWGITTKYPFFVGGGGNITQVEYFFDADPGFGNGNLINLASPANPISSNLNFNLGGLSEGMHTLFVRTKNEGNAWSLSYNRMVYVSIGEALVEKIEYFFDTDPGFGNGSPLLISPAISPIDMTYMIDLSTLSAGTHQLFIRVKNKNGTWSLTNFSSFSLTNPLPINLLIFKGNRLDKESIKLIWTTIQEANNSHFEIEKSNDAKDFQKIGLVDGLGNSNTEHNYEFIDNQAFTNSYYRLKQVDKDGKFNYSSVIYINQEEKEEFLIYPNPSSNQVNISLGKKRSPYEPIQLILSTLDGKRLLKIEAGISEAQNYLNQRFMELSSGAYILQVQANQKLFIKKVIKK